MRGSLAIAALVAVAGVAAALTYGSYTTERQFVRLVAQGDAAADRGQRFEALEAYSGALALVPDAVVPYLKRGRLYHEEGEAEAALRDLRRAAELDPSATRPLEWMGDISLELGRADRAADYFERAFAIDDRRADLAYKVGLARYRAGRPDEATVALESALVLDEDLAEARFLLGLCQRDQEDWPAARATLELVVKSQPAATAPRDALIEVYRALGETNRMLDQLEAVTLLEPDRPERVVAAGLAYAEAGRDGQAVATLGRAAERFPDSPVALGALGRVWLEQAERRDDRVALAKALEALGAAATRGAVSGAVLADLGRAWLMAGDLAEAERTLRQAVARRPAEPSAFLDLASVAERQGRPQEARDALLQHLGLIGDGAPVGPLALRVAELSVRIGEPRRAIRWAERAIAEAGESGDALAVLAEAALNVGDRTRADAAVTEGLRRAPGHPRLLRLRRQLAVTTASRGDVR